MGKNENTVTISVKFDTYDDFVDVKSELQQNKDFMRRMKVNRKRNTVAWDDVARFMVQCVKTVMDNDGLLDDVVKHTRM